MWRRKQKESFRPYYIRSPAELVLPWSTMSGGPGIAELAEDGLRFVGESGRHHFEWRDMETWEVEGEAMRIKMNVGGGGGYQVEVLPDDGGLHRWAFLLPHKGVARAGGKS